MSLDDTLLNRFVEQIDPVDGDAPASHTHGGFGRETHWAAVVQKPLCFNPPRPLKRRRSSEVGTLPITRGHPTPAEPDVRGQAATAVAETLADSDVEEVAPPGPSNAAEVPWQNLDDLHLANLKIFGNARFRDRQEAICRAALANKDCFVLMPTGGGKSLCFQLPSVLTPGLSLVISPLISLMVDQVKALVDKDFPATYLSSNQTETDRKAVYRELRKQVPSCKLLYVTPEQLVKSEALRDILSALYGRGMLSRLVVDEAHCISAWGHDFRKEYQSIGKVRADHFPNLPVMALTATATKAVQRDVKRSLGMKEGRLAMFQVSFNRPNIFWRVVCKEEGNTSGGVPKNVKSIAEYIQGKWAGQSGIVYCLTREDTEVTATFLREEFGIQATFYHAGLTTKQRNAIQIGFKEGDVAVICATIAFGMGVDNPHVRFVVHQSIPKSLEGYYQEAGRAGRDGRPAEALLMYSPDDVRRNRNLINSGKVGKKQRETQYEKLDLMQVYCLEKEDCRRCHVLRYFGESFQASECRRTCDNCKNVR